MTSRCLMNEREKLKTKIESELLERFGPMLYGKELAVWLGYPSVAAFRQAKLRGKVPVATFRIQDRKGYFAMSEDVADWLSRQRYPEKD